jgi:dCMP deaminase
VRTPWPTYFMNIARAVATRATCDRKHVGCVLVRDNRILSTGYNGSARGLAHCDDVGHLMENGHCVATVHAEVNAVAQAAQNGVALEGAIAYVTAHPCWNCFKTLRNAGVLAIVYDEAYRPDPKFMEAFAQLGGHSVLSLTEYLALDPSNHSS